MRIPPTHDLPHPVYPGHALMVALHIMKVFPKASEALKTSSSGSWPACVGHIEVPGAGCGAYAGADLIRKLQVARREAEKTFRMRMRRLPKGVAGGYIERSQLGLPILEAPRGHLSSEINVLGWLEAHIQWSHINWERRVGPRTGNHEKEFLPGLKEALNFEDRFRDAVMRYDWT